MSDTYFPSFDSEVKLAKNDHWSELHHSKIMVRVDLQSDPKVNLKGSTCSIV